MPCSLAGTNPSRESVSLFFCLPYSFDCIERSFPRMLIINLPVASIWTLRRNVRTATMDRRWVSRRACTNRGGGYGWRVCHQHQRTPPRLPLTGDQRPAQLARHGCGSGEKIAQRMRSRPAGGTLHPLVHVRLERGVRALRKGLGGLGHGGEISCAPGIVLRIGFTRQED